MLLLFTAWQGEGERAPSEATSAPAMTVFAEALLWRSFSKNFFSGSSTPSIAISTSSEKTQQKQSRKRASSGNARSICLRRMGSTQSPRRWRKASEAPMYSRHCLNQLSGLSGGGVLDWLRELNFCLKASAVSTSPP